VQIPFDVCLWSEVNRLKSNFEFSSSKFGSLTRGQNLNFRKLFKKISVYFRMFAKSKSPWDVPRDTKIWSTECQNRKNEIEKIGCEIANNRFSLHSSRKTKITDKIKSVEDIYFHSYFNRTKPISSRFFGCEFDPFYNRIGCFKKIWNRNKPNRSFLVLEFRCIWLV